MSSVSAVRALLVVQAGLTAVFALTSPLGGWTLATMLVAAGTVFVAAMVQPTPQWRSILSAVEGFAVAFGLLALSGGHFVPGTIVAGGVLAMVTHGSAAPAFAGEPVGPVLPAFEPVPEAAPVAAARVIHAPLVALVAEPAVVAPAVVEPAREAVVEQVAFWPPPSPEHWTPPAPLAPVVLAEDVPVPVAPVVEPVVEPVIEVPAQPRVAPLAITVLPGR
jgi:hypothetical protein